MINNHIHGASSWQPAGILLNGSHDHYIYNNLIFDAPNGIDSSGGGITRIRNNIILDVTESQNKGQNGYHILAEIPHLDDILITEFTSRFTDLVGINSDIFDMPRTQGSYIDIGPFEQGSSHPIEIVPIIPATEKYTGRSNVRIKSKSNTSLD